MEKNKRVFLETIAWPRHRQDESFERVGIFDANWGFEMCDGKIGCKV